jgi:hypothetical protein
MAEEKMIWTTDTARVTYHEAAAMFARTFWPDGPRKVVNWEYRGRRFQTSGGVAWYRIYATKVKGFDCYVIDRE